MSKGPVSRYDDYQVNALAREYCEQNNAGLDITQETTKLTQFISRGAVFLHIKSHLTEEKIYVEQRRVSFMYFIVDKRIFLLSAKFTVGPYRYRCDWFPK